jgi:hypothetical protein
VHPKAVVARHEVAHGLLAPCYPIGGGHGVGSRTTRWRGTARDGCSRCNREAEVVVCFTWPTVDGGDLAMVERAAVAAQLVGNGWGDVMRISPRWTHRRYGLF